MNVRKVGIFCDIVGVDNLEGDAAAQLSESVVEPFIPKARRGLRLLLHEISSQGGGISG